jgi:hypothetical protein
MVETHIGIDAGETVELLDRVRQGDASVFEELFKRVL